MDYRHELKYEVDEIKLNSLDERIGLIMNKDIHQQRGAYTITSLYFDDVFDTCLQENVDGVDRRSKYRIRIYNHCTDVIKLEKKSKLRGMTHKDAVTISREECLSFMRGEIPIIRSEYSELKKMLLCEMQWKGMRPKTIVEYMRTAYVEKIGNVRITFDRNIEGSERIELFLENNIGGVPLLRSGVHVLEIKYDELLPGYIADTMEIGTLMRTSFSKYAYSRLNGGLSL